MSMTSPMPSQALTENMRELSCQRRDLKALPWKFDACASKPPPSSTSSSRRTETPPLPSLMSPPPESGFCGLSWCGKLWHRWWGGVPGGSGLSHGRGLYRWMGFKVGIGKKVSLAYLITFDWLVVQKPEALEWWNPKRWSVEIRSIGVGSINQSDFMKTIFE